MENKKAITAPTTTGLIIIVFFAISLLVTLAVFAYAGGIFDDTISKLDFTLGNISFNESYQSLVHPSMVVLTVSGPRNMSIATIIGMVLVLLFVAMKSKERSKLWILLDIFIIIIAEMAAVAIKKSFEDYILHLTPELFVIFSNTLAASSKWILNLPIIIPTIGALVMIATHILNKEDKEGRETQGFIEIE